MTSSLQAFRSSIGPWILGSRPGAVAVACGISAVAYQLLIHRKAVGYSSNPQHHTVINCQQKVEEDDKISVSGRMEARSQFLFWKLGNTVISTLVAAIPLTIYQTKYAQNAGTPSLLRSCLWISGIASLLYSIFPAGHIVADKLFAKYGPDDQERQLLVDGNGHNILNYTLHRLASTSSYDPILRELETIITFADNPDHSPHEVAEAIKAIDLHHANLKDKSIALLDSESNEVNTEYLKAYNEFKQSVSTCYVNKDQASGKTLTAAWAKIAKSARDLRKTITLHAPWALTAENASDLAKLADYKLDIGTDDQACLNALKLQLESDWGQEAPLRWAALLKELTGKSPDANILLKHESLKDFNISTDEE